MRRIKIAQIGLNRYSHSGEILDTMKSMPEVFDLVGYALVEDERETCQKKMKHLEGCRELTLEQILEDPTIEAVTIETDEIHLNKYAQMALEHGKHVHMEKPGSQDPESFRRLIETVKAGDKVFHVGYMFRYNPFISEAVRRARAGELGLIYSIEAQMSRFDDPECREWFGTFKGGMMFYLGCHLIDLILQIQGMPEKIIPVNTVTGIDGIHTEDLGFAVLQYPNAVSVIRMGGTEVGGARRRQLVVCGSKETLELRPLEHSERALGKYMLTTGRYRAVMQPGQSKAAVTEDRSEPFDRYRDMLLAFAAMVRGEKKNPYTADYELALFETVLRCCGMEL